MEKLNFVFQTDSEEVNKVYQENTNYLIEDSENVISNEDDFPICAIYFSSHDIYFPNTPEAFQNQLVKKNRFEWYGTRITRAHKHIFLRDIKKQWYLNGINSELNSIEKVVDFLKKETLGYRVITLGGSAGGYAAVLFGQLLKAELTITFNGQFQLYDLLNDSNEGINPTVFREQNNPKISCYFSLLPILSCPGSIFYFYSGNSKWDLIQYQHLNGAPINYIRFKTSHHGIPFLKSSLPSVINSEQQELRSFTQNAHNPLLFSIKMDGLCDVATSIFLQSIKVLKRKLGK